ncbi:MAG: hypothetical protein AABX29_00675 [Nanoarchaeota archaeon]
MVRNLNSLERKTSDFSYDSFSDLGKYVWKYAIKPCGFVKMTKESVKEAHLGWDDKLKFYPAAYLVEGIRDFGYMYLAYNLFKNIF